MQISDITNLQSDLVTPPPQKKRTTTSSFASECRKAMKKDEEAKSRHKVGFFITLTHSFKFRKIQLSGCKSRRKAQQYRSIASICNEDMRPRIGFAYMFSIITSPKPEQDTCVAPSIKRAKS